MFHPLLLPGPSPAVCHLGNAGCQRAEPPHQETRNFAGRHLTWGPTLLQAPGGVWSPWNSLWAVTCLWVFLGRRFTACRGFQQILWPKRIKTGMFSSHWVPLFLAIHNSSSPRTLSHTTSCCGGDMTASDILVFPASPLWCWSLFRSEFDKVSMSPITRIWFWFYVSLGTLCCSRPFSIWNNICALLSKSLTQHLMLILIF